jgi:hypothetical protein
MKLLSRTLLKIASVKLAALAVLLVLGATATAMAQNPRIQTNQLDGLAAKASETVEWLSPPSFFPAKMMTKEK